jgi:crotonobetainyl-CoA:carnitine CoA-transferase CaiB-like acyl-CoA transferase
MSITGEADGTPMKAGVALADVMAGRDIAITLLAALAGRGLGTPVDRRLFVSLYHTAVSALVNVAQNALVTGLEAKRWGNAHANLVPYELFPAADRPIVVAVGSDAQFAALVGALELPELTMERFRTNAGRLEHRVELVAALRARFVTAPAVVWTARLDAAGVPNGVVRTVLEALADFETSPLTGIAPLAPARIRRAPPTLDEHGALVRELGWAAAQH